MKSHQGSLFRPRASDRIAPLHLCVNLGFVQARHVFIGIKINVMASGQQPRLHPPASPHTRVRIFPDIAYSCLSFSQQSSFSLIFFSPPAPSAMVERVLISDPIACSLARNMAAHCSHKDQGVYCLCGPGVKCYLFLLSLSGHADSLHSQALGSTGIVLICCREHDRV